MTIINLKMIGKYYVMDIDIYLCCVRDYLKVGLCLVIMGLLGGLSDLAE